MRVVEVFTRALGISRLIVVMAVIVVFVVAVGVVVGSASERACIERGELRCGNALIDELDQLQDRPDSISAERALTLVAMTTVLGDPGAGLEEQIDAELASAVAQLDTASASCVVDAALLFAKRHLDVKVGQDFIDVLDKASGLQSPVSTVASLALPSAGMDVAFATGTAVILIEWLRATPPLCTFLL